MTSLFRRLKELLNPPEPTGHSLGLSEGQIRKLHQLRTRSEWDALLAALDAVVKLKSAALLAPQMDDAALNFLRGELSGLRRAGTLVDEILQTEEQNERRRAESESRRTADPERRRLALYGTPAWADGAE